MANDEVDERPEIDSQLFVAHEIITDDLFNDSVVCRLVFSGAVKVLPYKLS